MKRPGRGINAAVLGCATAALFACPPTARASVERDELRAAILSGARLPEVINSISDTVSKSQDAPLVAEYSLALASSGLVSASLSEMDRAFLMDETDDQVLYAGSTLFAWLGMTQAADEIKRPAPGWANAPLPLLSKSRKRSDAAALGPYDEALKGASDLMGRSRYATALDRFARITAVYPHEPLGWAGYAVALEKIGAYKTAAKAVAMELSLSPQLADNERGLLVEHIRDLDAQEPLRKKAIADSLKGTYTAYAGGSLSGGAGSDTAFSFNAQLGKFLTNHFNVSADLGYSSSTHFSLGLGERYYFPIPGTPFGPTLGSRIEYDSTPAAADSGNLGFIVSPGLSFFTSKGSVDLFLDLGVAGAQSGTQSISVGYTYYFGSGQW